MKENTKMLYQKQSEVGLMKIYDVDNALAQGPGGSSPGPAGATSWPAADEAEKK